ncbi:hypothetical protein B0J13DRAFT_17527 [Dactylonectria estremocensis]|uniref:Uncharacterized protein n=1 Tax=Dactylonectria estremocensis TaxID=1079267 RepID=A0A9P9FIY2_9HYPO|nr:hypothetical protein B0J13DRAFT_17527 [Dactylonectria estremocensis]
MSLGRSMLIPAFLKPPLDHLFVAVSLCSLPRYVLCTLKVRYTACPNLAPIVFPFFLSHSIRDLLGPCHYPRRRLHHTQPFIHNFLHHFPPPTLINHQLAVFAPKSLTSVPRSAPSQRPP